MPTLIEHIDAIARKNKRGVLYIAFQCLPSGEDEVEKMFRHVDWENLSIRRQIICFLDERGIVWQRCGQFANVNEMMRYQGQLYVDVPYDQSLLSYRELAAFLENEDGSMRYPEATFYFLPLEKALENAAHDELGFWEQWAENF